MSCRRPPDDAARVIVSRAGKAIRVLVHPESLEVLHSVAEEDRPMRWLFRLHGELLMGNRGSAIVELASSWAIVMILTGLFLWWPRGVPARRGCLPAAGPGPPNLLARHPRRHRLLGLGIRPRPPADGPALGQVLGGLPAQRPAGDGHGRRTPGLDERCRSAPARGDRGRTCRARGPASAPRGHGRPACRSRGRRPDRRDGRASAVAAPRRDRPARRQVVRRFDQFRHRLDRQVNDVQPALPG